MLFTGIYELSVDPKNRLSIPSSIRAGLDPEKDGTNFYVVPGRQPGTLKLYSDKHFVRYAEECHSSLEPGRTKDEYEMIYFALATYCEVDSQGRILLPSWAMEKVGIGKQVTLTGAYDHLLLWNREDAKRFFEQNWTRHADLHDLARRESKPTPSAAEA